MVQTKDGNQSLKRPEKEVKQGGTSSQEPLPYSGCVG